MKNLTEKEMAEIVAEVGGKTFEYMKGMFVKTLSKHKETGHVDFMKVALITLSSIDCSVLFMLMDSYKNITGKEIDKAEIFSAYIKGTLHGLHENEKREILSKFH